MKKVRIITVQKAPNFGACLQAYALYKYLVDLGYDCKIIDLYRPVHKEFVYTEGFDPFVALPEMSLYKKMRYNLRPLKTFLLRVLGKDADYNFNKRYKIELEEASKRFFSFNNLMEYTEPYYSIQQLYDTPPEADFYITGSDQLWNPTQKYALEPFFLTFVKNGGKKISFATSIGVTDIPERVTKKFKEWLSTYDYISLREKAAVDFVSTLVDKTIYKIADPTFLLNKSQWSNLASYKEEVKEDYIFLFTLSYIEELYSYAINLSKKKNLKLVVWGHGPVDAFNLNYETILNIGPQEWLWLIKNAQYVITNSFHGSVFSLIFGVAFNVYISSDNNRGSRILNLLIDFNQLDRLLTIDDMRGDKSFMGMDVRQNDKYIAMIQKESADYINLALVR